MISFSIFGGLFTVRRGPTIATLIMVAVLIALGSWQVERLHWKQNLISEIATRMHMAPVDVSGLAANDALEYRPITASGTFQNDHELYLHSISLTGEGGYHVLTPLKLADGNYLLIDRGWVPFDRRQMVGIRDQNHDFYRPIGSATIKGLLRLPTHRWLQPADQPEQNEWFGIDLEAMAKAAGVPQFLPYVLEADATPNVGGYPVGGQTRLELPNNHMSYIITWYGLAVVLLVIYGISGWKRGR